MSASINAWLVPLARMASVVAVMCVAYLLLYLAGAVRLHPAFRLVVALFVLCAAVACAIAIGIYAPIVIAKGALVICLFGGGLFFLVLTASVPRIDRALNNIQRDCELATQLSFMQGEMTRAQLEEINERLKQAIAPEEKELTESMLKTLSPLVMLYFRKERSIIKWSVAAAKLGKGVFDYFFKS